MLYELAEYARTHGLAATAGFKSKNLKAYVLLSATGEYLGMDMVTKGTQVYAPDIGAAANGTRYCNPLVEKAKIPLCLVEDEVKDRNIPTKYMFFLSMLDSGAETTSDFSVIASALRDDATRSAIAADLSARKLTGADPIGFKVDGRPVEQNEAYFPWWAEFRHRFAPTNEGPLPRCLITGALEPNLATVPPVSGLLPVGGHSRGDAFLCFDKGAFQSYGLKQSANAAVSEEAMTAVNAALEDLLRKAPILGGAKQVHWYAGDVPDEGDVLGAFLWPNLCLPTDMSDEFDSNAKQSSEDEEYERETNDARAAASARRFFQSLRDGERPAALSARYYIMPLSGAGGRMMVRGWYEGRYEDLYRHMELWFDDLRLISADGQNLTRPPKMSTLFVRLLKPGGDSSKVPERIGKELSGLVGRVWDAAINGHALPDEVATRTLHWIRSKMLADSGKEGDAKRTYSFDRETVAFQLLKAWLRRKQRLRGDVTLMDENVEKSPMTVAYNCGRLMAVYGAIQQKAMPKVNVGVVERYYAAAAATPAHVIGKLAKLSVHHLAALDANPSLTKKANYYRRELDRIAADMRGTPVPRSLTLEQQTEFALSYYQQRAHMAYSPKTTE